MATLVSNDGESSLTVDFGTAYDYAHELGFESRACVTGRHWDGDHSHPISAELHGIWLHAGEIDLMCSDLSRWLDLPMAQQAQEELIGEYHLARFPGQKISFVFGSREDTINSRHPIISLSLHAGSFRLDYHFVTDQSCLRLFVHELKIK